MLLDSSEHNLFQIARGLESEFGSVAIEPVLGSVDDAALLDGILTHFQPQVVYHAAAYKHLPLLERNPISGVRNNAIGTYTLARAALRHGTAKLILVSTDKAVNPHSILGVSKRLAEMAVIALSGPACRMNAVRLCNVAGSPGSVVPIFLSQIAARKPVTVTHVDATRWFMSLGGAVQAILAGGTSEVEGRILIPEIGEPARILDLAICLIGDADVPVVFTGCRAGDKISEDIVFNSEIEDGTIGGGLRAFKTRRMDIAELEETFAKLSHCVEARDVPGLIRALTAAVPEYAPSEIWRGIQV